ncbi:MAG: hypothetical protein KDE54_36425 [Caldilineaceae bacterium]|nr:hypothetical protein [Caldilineaceae bacterium]MCB0141994.1 hypothetical protein [Caldilineaceae bacterium]
MSFTGYKTLETDIGSMVSESRTSVYDILLSQQEGDDFYAICVIHNLKPLQVQVALEYIEKHPAQLEAELPALLAQKAENERYHRAIAAERGKLIADLPMTPKRAAFYALREKNRHIRSGNGDSDTEG